MEQQGCSSPVQALLLLVLHSSLIYHINSCFLIPLPMSWFIHLQQKNIICSVCTLLCQYIMSYISLNSNILSNFQVLKNPFFLTYSDDFPANPLKLFFNILNFSSHRTSYNSDPKVFHLVRPSFLT